MHGGGHVTLNVGTNKPRETTNSLINALSLRSLRRVENVAAKHALRSVVQWVVLFVVSSPTTSIVQLSHECSALSRTVVTVDSVRPRRSTSMRRIDAYTDEFSAKSILPINSLHSVSVVELHGVETYSLKPQSLQGMTSRSEQKWSVGHAVGSEDPFTQIVPGGHGVGAVDPGEQDVNAGHCSTIEVLTQKNPGGHGDAAVVPGRQSWDWLHASICDGVMH